ncbi:hypothetical protein [Roseinatronobacter alkalisoli]|uniref:Uncharacterized protein n=1 Tax=Roseinatronobacter alkalisoli TaxID=3028235 RepID=A0ABT5TEH0_9RHOB|nr:hypothetical protein [Roseinatronobacter sp. HJB301]MDD7972781.1 hypothetical protein [Roseinatronobacter sp. HJB301]
MSDWENTSVIPCVGRSGERLTVIEQCRADRARQTLFMSEQDAQARRYVLGNGSQVEPLDRNRFVLPDTREIITRQ